MENDGVKQPWRLLTTHGLVLFYVWSHPGTTVREVTRALDITERQVRRVIADLVAASLLEAESDPGRAGRMIYRLGRMSVIADQALTLSGFTRILRALDSRDAPPAGLTLPDGPGINPVLP